MPRRKDIHKILVIGSGPIQIGQGCEFDYAAVQGCKVLKEEGLYVVLINSNPATIMTDPSLAHATYIEPIIVENIVKILIKEEINAILPTLGGQTALNVAMELWRNGILKKYGVELIGANPASIEIAEDRNKFRELIHQIDLNCPNSFTITHIGEVVNVLKKLTFPVIIRVSFTLGGEGSGVAYNEKELYEKVLYAISVSPIHQVILEESLIGWKEYELEIIKDDKENYIVICAIENIDPMGVHTGDSCVVCPTMTLSDKEYQHLRECAFKILKKVGIKNGGVNIQFAINPSTGNVFVIEMNPRMSRSSALASKATGYPIARIATKLAIGYYLNEIHNEITGKTACFEPVIDYVVVKIPRFDFDKFPGASGILSTSMQSVGEVMGIGRNFAEAFQKAICSLDLSWSGLDSLKNHSTRFIMKQLKKFLPYKFLWIAEALRRGIDSEEIRALTHYNIWFIKQIEIILLQENISRKKQIFSNLYELKKSKSLGISDERLANLIHLDESQVRFERSTKKIYPAYKVIDTCAGEFPTKTPYLYSTHEMNYSSTLSDDVKVSNKEKVIIIGSGPNRIGQGIEFDYACVKGVQAIKHLGFESILINCNPETVSTDYTTADKLYFEPLTEEKILDIIYKEKANGIVKGVITQFGGQTALKCSTFLHKHGHNILGPSVREIEITENRQLFQRFCQTYNFPQPKSCIIKSPQEFEHILDKINLPIILRPSYVLGGGQMKVIYKYKSLKMLLTENFSYSKGPLLAEEFISDAQEIDVDGIAQGSRILILAIMEHLEPGGIHSGDSCCFLEPFSLPSPIIEEIKELTHKIMSQLNTVGLFNIQFIYDGLNQCIYVIEVNLRASRSLPFVEKARGINAIQKTVRMMLGYQEDLDNIISQNKFIENKKIFFLKKPIFSFHKILNASYELGPEMRSTGEIMALGNSYKECFAKAQLADPTFIIFKQKKWFISCADNIYEMCNFTPFEKDYIINPFNNNPLDNSSIKIIVGCIPATLPYFHKINSNSYWFSNYKVFDFLALCLEELPVYKLQELKNENSES